MNSLAIFSQTLRSIGIIESYESTQDLVTDGPPLKEDTLLNILNFSKKEINEDKSFTMDEVKRQIENWKKK